MVSVFDLDKLYGLLKDFYQITQIRITVFDAELKELVSYPEEVAAVCRVIRSCSAGIDACVECDRKACDIASQKGKTYIYRCHAGLTEAVTPLYVSDVLVGYLLFGHVFSYDDREEGLTAIRAACAYLPIDMEALEKACRERPMISYDFVRSATHILHAVASFLVMERMAMLQEDKLAVQLDAYLSAHFTENFTAQELCEEFGIGKTQLYKLSNQLYGYGISTHIRNLRMEKAKAMLSDNGNMAIAEIASLCGYTDYNYFISVFSREVGCSPGAYRKRNH